MESGVVEAQPIKPLAHVLLGALTEAAMVISHAEDPISTRTSVARALQRLLDGLRQ